MVNIHRHELAATVSDEQALELFRRQWAVYQKLIDNDYVNHAEVYGILHQVLADEVKGRFRVLDLACGDASAIVGALRGTQIAHYHGIDLARPALELAERSLDTLGCEVELEQRDFIEALRDRPEPADVVWFGLSLHHLPTADKRTLMREIRGVLDEHGRFLMYEPTSPDGEDRNGYLSRFEQTSRQSWTALTPAEWQALMTHVRTCDLPETVSSWIALGHEAGFRAADELFKAPSDLYRMFCYRA
jgi:ubiquinone/menaquinone biosynthesis C-methylase UbiE